MRTILRFETKNGEGPSGTYWFDRHYAKMTGIWVVEGFEPGTHYCAIDMRGASYWMTPACLKDAEKAGLKLLILNVWDCLDEKPGYDWFQHDAPLDDEGRRREWQVAFDKAHVIDCVEIKPTEFRHVAYC